MYSADNIEPHLTGVVRGYLLPSNNAAALPCKRHENAAVLLGKHHKNGSKNTTKVVNIALVYLKTV